MDKVLETDADSNGALKHLNEAQDNINTDISVSHDEASTKSVDRDSASIPLSHTTDEVATSATTMSAAAVSGDIATPATLDAASSAIGSSETAPDRVDGELAAARVDSDEERESDVVIGSVSDLKVMSKEELPPEDLLQAQIQAIIAKTQQSTEQLEQALKQRKVW